MRAASRIRKLDDGGMVNSRAAERGDRVARNKDGSVAVFPAQPA
ncbi:hypothetical protein [Streptomyces sp. NPDC054834]